MFLLRVSLVGCLVVLAACDGEDEGARPPRTSQSTAPEATTAPADPSGAEADRFLPPLEGYRVDDDPGTSDEIAALDDAEVPYRSVRRRLVLDERGLTKGTVLAITFAAGSGADEKFLRAQFGDVPRRRVEVEKVDMSWIPQAFGSPDALVWTGPTFVVVFTRGGDVDQQWLLDLARATVAGATA
jgi:hypothetical protein